MGDEREPVNYERPVHQSGSCFVWKWRSKKHQNIIIFPKICSFKTEKFGKIKFYQHRPQIAWNCIFFAQSDWIYKIRLLMCETHSTKKIHAIGRSVLYHFALHHFIRAPKFSFQRTFFAGTVGNVRKCRTASTLWILNVRKSQLCFPLLIAIRRQDFLQLLSETRSISSSFFILFHEEFIVGLPNLPNSPRTKNINGILPMLTS